MAFRLSHCSRGSLKTYLSSIANYMVSGSWIQIPVMAGIFDGVHNQLQGVGPG